MPCLNALEKLAFDTSLELPIAFWLACRSIFTCCGSMFDTDKYVYPYGPATSFAEAARRLTRLRDDHQACLVDRLKLEKRRSIGQ